jgi:hypothetical protein
MRHPYATQEMYPTVPISLGSVLLIDAEPELRVSRRLLFAALNHPVLAVASYKDIWTLPRDSNCILVVICLAHLQHEASRIASHVRLTWPTARILILGRPQEDFDDPLYDDAVDPLENPTRLLEVTKRLIAERHWPK